MNLKIFNSFQEKLDVLVEGDLQSDKTVVFVHGFGTNKNEGTDLFVDISREIGTDYKIVRFDFSGYGNSEGKQEEVNYEKQTYDLESVLDHVRNQFQGEIFIIAHSMGTFITSLLSPEGIKKAVFTGIPQQEPKEVYNTIKSRILKKADGVFNERGISRYLRSSGEVQKIGAKFWKILLTIKPIELFEAFAQKTDLILFKPIQDHVTAGGSFDKYRNSRILNWVELNGDHNFSKPQDRVVLINKIKDFLS